MEARSGIRPVIASEVACVTGFYITEILGERYEQNGTETIVFHIGYINKGKSVIE